MAMVRSEDVDLVESKAEAPPKPKKERKKSKRSKVPFLPGTPCELVEVDFAHFKPFRLNLIKVINPLTGQEQLYIFFANLGRQMGVAASNLSSRVDRFVDKDDSYSVIKSNISFPSSLTKTQFNLFHLYCSESAHSYPYYVRFDDGVIEKLERPHGKKHWVPHSEICGEILKRLLRLHREGVNIFNSSEIQELFNGVSQPKESMSSIVPPSPDTEDGAPSHSVDDASSSGSSLPFTDFFQAIELSSSSSSSRDSSSVPSASSSSSSSSSSRKDEKAVAPSVSVLSVFNSGTKRRRIANIADLEKMESLSRATFLDVIAGKKEVSESDRLPLLSFVAAACREEEQEEERYVHSKGSGKR